MNSTERSSHIRRLSLLLTLTVLGSFFGTLPSCGSSGADADGTTAAESDTSSAEETTANRFNDGLPEKDFGGREFRIAVSMSNEPDIRADEMNGDITSDAVYERNRTIEERFNVNITSSRPSDESNNWYEKLKTIVLAGDDVYDLAGHSAFMMYTPILAGIYRDWNKVNYIDRSREWWAEKINESATINGKLFGISGYLGMSLMQYSQAVFYNVRQVGEYGHSPEELNSLVFDGKWTFAKLSELVSDMYVDLNNNGNRDDTDFYGYAIASGTGKDLWQGAFDMPITKREGDRIIIDLVTEKRVAALEMINSFFETNIGAKRIAYNTDESSWRWYEQYNFSVGRQALTTGVMLAAYDLYRGMTDEYGILPLPKFDENQTEYYSNLNDGFTVWGIPVTVTDTDFVGIITEAMASESLRTVYPAFYDVALKNKFSRDEDTARMVDIITEGAVYDVSYMFGNYLSGLPYIFRERIEYGSNALASVYEGKKATIEKKLEDVYAAYKD